MMKRYPHSILAVVMLFSIIVLGACQPAPTPTVVSPTLDATQVALAVDATLTVEAGQIPTSTQVPPTSTPQPTATAPLPTFTPSLPEGDPALELGAPDGIDTFDSAINFAPMSNNCFASQITGGQFVMAAKGLQDLTCWTTSWPALQDFYIETGAVNPDACASKDTYGLLVRSPDSTSGYLFGLNCAGQYSLRLMSGGSGAELIPPTSSNAILVGPGAVNRLGIGAYSGNFYLYANGVYLADTTDYTYVEAGDIGYFINASTSSPFTSLYDELKVWVLDDAYYPSSAPPPNVPSVEPVPPASGAPYVTATTSVNVRSGPGTNYPVYGVAPAGAIAPVTGISPDGAWYVITISTDYSADGIAWVSAGYVTLSGITADELPVVQPPPPPAEVTPEPPTAGSGTVQTTEPVNVRAGPGSEYPSYGTIPAGTTLQAVGISADGIWVAVAIPTSIAPDGVGWVSAAYLQPFDPESISTTQP
jgi:uncharacterized protein YraI